MTVVALHVPLERNSHPLPEGRRPEGSCVQERHTWRALICPRRRGEQRTPQTVLGRDRGFAARCNLVQRQNDGRQSTFSRSRRWRELGRMRDHRLGERMAGRRRGQSSHLTQQSTPPHEDRPREHVHRGQYFEEQPLQPSKRVGIATLLDDFPLLKDSAGSGVKDAHSTKLAHLLSCSAEGLQARYFSACSIQNLAGMYHWCRGS